MKNADRGLQRRVIQIRVETLQISRHDQPFVGHHPIREATDVEIGVIGQRHFGFTTRCIQLAHTVLVINAVGVNEHLLDPGQLIQRDFTADALVNRHFSPTPYGQALFAQGLGHGFSRLCLKRLITAEEHHAHGVVLPQVHVPDRFRLGAHECVGHLQQQSAAITGAAVCSDTAAMRHAGERFNRRLQQAMAGLALDMGDQTKATIVPELFGAVETARGCRLTLDATRIYCMIHRPFRF